MNNSNNNNKSKNEIEELITKFIDSEYKNKEREEYKEELIRILPNSNNTEYNISIKSGQNERSCLHICCMYGYEELIDILFKTNKILDINQRDKDGYTALVIAANYSRYRICKLLLQKGADINCVDSVSLNIYYL